MYNLNGSLTQQGNGRTCRWKANSTDKTALQLQLMNDIYWSSFCESLNAQSLSKLYESVQII
jgi:hypothetical protein